MVKTLDQNADENMSVLGKEQDQIVHSLTCGLIKVCRESIDYFPIPHNTLCLPPKFCITYCLKMLLGKCNTPRSI